MTLSDSQRNALARLLAKALPEWSDREAVASAAGLRDVQLTGAANRAWRALVDEAVAQQRLPSLIRSAARRRPDDATLSRLASGLEQGRLLLPRPGRVALAFLTGVVVAGVYVFVMPGGGTDASDVGEPVYGEPAALPDGPDLTAQPTAPPELVEADVPVSGEGEAGDHAGGAPGVPEVSAAQVAAASDPTTAPAPALDPAPAVPPAPPVAPPSPPRSAEPAPSPPAADVPPVRRAAASPPCAEASGFAYLGEETRLTAGVVWTVPTAVNVRAEVPDASNNFNARSELQCVLPSGVKMRVGEAPIEVPGGAYWIPVRGEWIIP